ncbi:type II toxin-antitoxin system HicB family antitoxin [Pannonibacter carbonis]|uniref:type II toxin-antitoxin system HicB family antitoxin n=1 Tax=Pannonibacter carbonis TaxID=2067569 RepID=UPI000D0E50E3|nr:type II toxin-antitoxin system HicB family antitoxin [Pannonibacter carbonis]
MRYVAFLHQDDGPGYGISFPDFPGCVSVGDTVDDAIRNGADALAFHAEGMIEDGEGLPVARDLASILADPALAEWREGAAFAYVPVVIDRGSPRRVNISLDPGLLGALDEAAKSRGMTRSAFIASAAWNEILGLRRSR